MKKLSLLVLMLVLIVLVSFGCAPPEEVAEEKEEGEKEEQESETAVDNPAAERPDELVIGGQPLDGVFNPPLQSTLHDGRVMGMIFDSLLTIDESGEITTDQRSLAEDYEISDDGLEYVFHLREGVEFHDGEEVTADDVEFTFEVTAHPDYDGPRANWSDNIVGVDEYIDGETDELEGITIEDDHTIKIESQEPDAGDIYDYSVYVMPKHYYEFDDYDEIHDLTEDPMGSGPFELDEYRPDEHAILTAFDDYYHGEPQVDRIIYEELESEQQIPAVETGEADIVRVGSTPENHELLEQIDHQETITFLGNSYEYIGIQHNVDGEPNKHMENRKVRQALAYALDIDAFIEGMYGEELAQPIGAPFSPVSWVYPDEDLNYYEFDPDKANELLDKAGYEWDEDEEYRYNEDGDRLEVSWDTQADDEWSEHITTLALEQWPEIGIDLDVELYEFNTLVTRLDDNRGDFDLWNMGWSLGSDPDPSSYFSVDYSDYGEFNTGEYHNEEAEELMEEGLEEFDQDKREEIYKDLARVFNEDLPYIFVHSGKDLWSSNNRVENFEPSTWQAFNWNVHEWEVTEYDEN